VELLCPKQQWGGTTGGERITDSVSQALRRGYARLGCHQKSLRRRRDKKLGVLWEKKEIRCVRGRELGTRLAALRKAGKGRSIKGDQREIPKGEKDACNRWSACIIGGWFRRSLHIGAGGPVDATWLRNTCSRRETRAWGSNLEGPWLEDRKPLRPETGYPALKKTAGQCWGGQ